jgi:hypothetical protein
MLVRAIRFPTVSSSCKAPRCRVIRKEANGFFFVRCTELSRYAWTLVFENHDKVMSYRSQQMVVNQVTSSLRERGLRVSRLPEREYRNGHGTHRIEHRKEEAEFSDARVVHVSWTADIENKLAKLRDNGLWYL